LLRRIATSSTVTNSAYFPCLRGQSCLIVKRKPLVVTWLDGMGHYWRTIWTIRGSIAELLKRLDDSGSLMVSWRYRQDERRTYTVSRQHRTHSTSFCPASILSASRYCACVGPATDVLFAGRLISEKRVDLLLNAIAIAQTRIRAIGARLSGTVRSEPRSKTWRSKLDSTRTSPLPALSTKTAHGVHEVIKVLRSPFPFAKGSPRIIEAKCV